MKKIIHNRLHKIILMVTYNAKAFWGFELFIKIIGIFVLAPLLGAGLTLSMEVTAHTYLTPENIGSFMKNPITIIVALLSLFLLSVYIVIDISGILLVCNESMMKNKITVRETIVFAFQTVIRCFRKKNIRIFLIPVTYVFLMCNGALAGVLTIISVPEFLLVLIKRAKYIFIGMLVFYFLIQIYAIRCAYLMHYYVLERCDYQTARKMAHQINLKHKIKDYLCIWGYQAIYYLAYILTLVIGLGLALIISKYLGNLKLFSTITIQVIWISMAIILLMFVALSIPFGMCTLSLHFYQYKVQKGEKLSSVYEMTMPVKSVPRLLVRIYIAAGAVSILIGGFVTVRGVIKGTLNPPIEYVHTTEITAHRGASRMYPENTMAAFEHAVEQSTDWIELDVQLSKDHQVFVMHDTSFRRTTGLRKNAWELDYDEIAELDAGSFKSADFKGERIPLLADVIDFAIENNVRLNIEMKPNGHNEGIEQAVVDLIVEKEFQDYCVITSQAYKMLSKIKEIDEEISTVYVVSLAAGNMSALTCADAFSIEANSITKRMVSRIHNTGKQVYVWTVNSTAGMRRMMDMNVDNIITDNVTLAYKCVYEQITNSVVRQYVRFLLRL